MFLKEIPFASLINAIDMKIERVLTGFLIGWANSHIEPSIDASYHVSVHLAKLFQSRRFLEIDLLEIIIVCGDHVC